MKPRSGRTIPLYFKVSPEEKEIIEKKMAQLGIHNQRALFTENGGRRVCGAGGYVRLQSPGVPAAKLRQ